MSTGHVRVIEGDKFVLPSALRRRHGFEVGKILVVDDSPDGVTIRSLDEAVAAAQAIMAKVAPASRELSDELIGDRRAEAGRGYCNKPGQPFLHRRGTFRRDWRVRHCRVFQKRQFR